MRGPDLLGFFAWPARASTVAGDTDALFIALLVVSGLLVLVLLVLNVTFLVRFRRGSPAPRKPLVSNSWYLEAGWIGATAVVFLGFFGWGGCVYLGMSRPPPGQAYELTVVGRQWMWDVRHPNGRREFDQVHLPVGEPVRVTLSSEDVIHSFFVPAFRVKLDAVPGKVSQLWFTPTREGVFHLFCAEFCGTKHSEMGGAVVVQSAADHAAWLEAGNVQGEVAARGRALFARHGCSGCHAPESPIHAPMLEGIYGRRLPLSDGTFVTVDDRYLRDSILQPRREIAAGFEPVMPSFEGVLTENEVLDLVTYLKSLRNLAPAEAERQPIPPNLP